MLDYDGNAVTPAKVGRKWKRILTVPLVVRDREYVFSQDVIVVDTGALDPNLGILAKISSLIEVLRVGRSYKLVYQNWAQFTLSSVRVNVNVTWLRDEVSVSISICPVLSTYPVCIQFVARLLYHAQWDASPNFVSLRQLNRITLEQQRGVRRTRQRCAGLSSHVG